MNEAARRPAVVITGASSGIGRELARVAAEDGHTLMLVGRDEPALRQLASELSKPSSAPIFLTLDLQQSDAVDRIEACLAEHALYCDTLINSAGFGIFGPVAGIDQAQQLGLIDVNIRAVTSLIGRFLPSMVERGRGGIINIGSITGYAPGPYMAAYCASKAFIRSYSAALAGELAGTGVRVMCLTPGIVRTAFFDRPPMGQMRNRMRKLLPRGDAVRTARRAWRAYHSGQSIVVPRPIDRFIIGICSLLPDRVLTRLVRWLQQPE